jgi:type III pantothenate kinase
MKPDFVADVGNSRIKWGRCTADRVEEYVSLPAENTSAWTKQVQAWNLQPGSAWAVSGVDPKRLRRLAIWLRKERQTVKTLTSWQQLPIRVDVDYPSKVGMDRLLNAVAARQHVQREISLFIIDAGSAVTVDWVDATGTFRGGAIFPGFALMAKALHDYTALLPEVSVSQRANLEVPGTNTRSAIEAGVFWAVAGAIRALLRQFTGRAGADRRRAIFLTGGDGPLLAAVLESSHELWPEMTLEGIRLAAEALP